VSFIQFLRQKVSANQMTDEQIEGLEVAVQCLETAFDVSDKNYAFQSSKPLLDIFTTAEGQALDEEEFPTPSQADIEHANRLKEEGNELVKASKYDEAIVKYNEAIKLYRDPIYFCNRAAVYCRLEQFDLAIQDCRTALALDPQYAKAYGRMGVALSCQNRYGDAVEAYKKALEIDPDNESYKQNLGIAERELADAGASFAQAAQANPMGGLPGMPGGFNLAGLLNNPQMVQMASQMVADPNIQGLMSQMMSSFMGPGAQAGGADGAGAPNFAGMENLLRAGESLAQRMEQTNPEVVQQLRRTFGSIDPNQPNGDQQGVQPPNPDDKSGNGAQPPPGSG